MRSTSESASGPQGCASSAARSSILAAITLILCAIGFYSPTAHAETGLVQYCADGPGFDTTPENGCPTRGWKAPEAGDAVLSCTAEPCEWFSADLVFRLWEDLAGSMLVQACALDIEPGPFSDVDPCGNRAEDKPWRLKSALTGEAPEPIELTPGDATLNWTNPTQRTDGSALPASELQNIMLFWGQTCEIDALLSAPESQTAIIERPAPDSNVPQTHFIDGLAAGEWCFIARAADTSGISSDPSNIASKTILARPSEPSLETAPLVVAETPVYGPSRLPDANGIFRVGDVPIGTPCIETEALMAGGEVYYAVPRAEVEYPPGVASPDVNFARCRAAPASP